MRPFFLFTKWTLSSFIIGVGLIVSFPALGLDDQQARLPVINLDDFYADDLPQKESLRDTALDWGQDFNASQFRSKEDITKDINQSKNMVIPSGRDRLLSRLIHESIIAHYYDIAYYAASHISMPIVRDDMYRHIALHCMEYSGENCIE